MRTNRVDFEKEGAKVFQDREWALKSSSEGLKNFCGRNDKFFMFRRQLA